LPAWRFTQIGESPKFFGCQEANMQKSTYLKMLFALQFRLDGLDAQLTEQVASPSTGGKATESLLQWHDVQRMKTVASMLRYLDPADIPSSVDAMAGHIDAEFERLRREGPSPLSDDLNHAVQQLDKDLFGIIHPMEVIGKWPPDGWPR
jgi:hypothetical protein